MKQRIHYAVKILNPDAHLMEVTVHVRGPFREEERLGLPVWTPGSYMVREYSQFIQDIACKNENGGEVDFRQQDKRTWVIQPGSAQSIHFSYVLYANSLTVRTNHVDDTHGFICGAATFMALEGNEADPVSVELDLPAAWSVATTMPVDDDGDYQASNFDILVDTPIETGHLHRVDFEAGGKPHAYVFWGEGNWDEEALINDTIKVIEETAAHYGGELPYEQYYFIVHSARGIRGGLEHLDSTVLAWDSLGFQPLSEHEEFMRLVAHEFYHTWNVKRTRARVLGPFDYSKENYTKMLWLHEGGTVYYEGLIPVRCGILRRESWLREMGKSVHTLRSFPGRKHQSVGESSFNAWTKLYRRNEHSQNSMISYYLKGELVCVCLDKLIRENTGGEKSLDDVMRLFYERSAQPNPGFLDEEVAPWIAEVAGMPVDDFLAAYVDGLEPLPLEETFAWYGLTLEGKHEEDKERGPGASLGIKTSAAMGRAKVTYVSEEGAGLAGGLQAFDEIIALDGLQVNNKTLGDRLKDRKPGDVVTLTLFRRERLRELTVTLGERPFDSYVLKASEEATDEQKARFEDLLRVPFPDDEEDGAAS